MHNMFIQVPKILNTKSYWSKIVFLQLDRNTELVGAVDVMMARSKEFAF